MSPPGGPVDPRLRNLLGGDELAGIRQRLRRHFARQAAGTESTSLRLSGLSPLEYQALAGITGRRAREAGSIQLDIASIDGALRTAGLAPSLLAALEMLEGPIPRLIEQRASLEAHWRAVIDEVDLALMAAYLTSPASVIALKRAARQEPETARRLLRETAAVLRRLPAPGLPRAQLAAETLGDAHALDNGRGAANLVLAVWKHRESTLDQAVENERSRDTWARAGVLVNELARPALSLNIPLRSTNAAAVAGEPYYLSLRQLVRSPPAWKVDNVDVFVCENPNIVAIAADRLGAACAPLVCTDGMPSAAQRTLLSQLLRAGARLRYHGDFDWPGIQIANYVLRTWTARPWRMSTGDYEFAVTQTQSRPPNMDGKPVSACWDGDLEAAMRRHELAIPEEAVASMLLEDLLA